MFHRMVSGVRNVSGREGKSSWWGRGDVLIARLYLRDCPSCLQYVSLLLPSSIPYSTSVSSKATLITASDQPTLLYRPFEVFRLCAAIFIGLATRHLVFFVISFVPL